MNRGSIHVNTFFLTAESTQPRTRRRVRSSLVSGLLAAALSGVGLVPLAAPASAAPLAEVGPIDNATGYPFWFGDGGDPGQGLDPLRLELCLDDLAGPAVPRRG